MNAPLNHDGSDEEVYEPPSLRRLRLLVTVLTSVLIFGMLTMVVVFVIRLGGIGTVETVAATLEQQVAAEEFRLPAGAEVKAVGRGATSVLIVTAGPEGEVLRIFDAASGTLLSTSRVERD